MKNLVNHLLTPRTSLNQPVQYQREKILAVALLTSIVLGIGVYASRLYVYLRTGSWDRIILISLALCVGLITTFITKIPYRVRAGIALGYFYIFGTISSFDHGLSRDTLIWLTGFAFFSAIYFGFRGGITATFLGTSTMLLVGIGLNQDWFSTIPLLEIHKPEALVYWINPITLYLVIGILTAYMVDNIFENLGDNIRKKEEKILGLDVDIDRLEQRATILERRENQVRTAAQISQNISAQLDPDKLFPQVVEMVRGRFNLYYVGVFLVDSGGQFAVLSAGSGDAGRSMLEAGHKLPIGGTSMIGVAISHGQARIAQDVDMDLARFENPILPNTRSELALPMISGKKVVGAITIQSENDQAFDENDIIVLQGVADSLAIAHENAVLFQQIETNLNEIQTLNQRYLVEAWSEVVNRTGEIRHSFEASPRDPIPDIPPQSINKPIILRDQVIGNILLERDEKHLEPEEETFVEAVATQAALALENLRLMEASQRSAHHNRVVADLSTKVWATSDPNTILSTALKDLVEALLATKGEIRLDIPDARLEIDPNGDKEHLNTNIMEP
jgi:GAF domain-containing protein